MSYEGRHRALVAKVTKHSGRTRAAAVALAATAATGAAYAGLGAGVANAATGITAKTYISNHPDGGHGTPGTWAYDDYTRTLTVTPASSADCPSMPSGDTCYTASLSDNGKFNAIVGAGSPSGATGVQISHAVQGTMVGTGSFVLYAPTGDALTGKVPTYENDNYKAPANSADDSSVWPLLAFSDPSSVKWVNQEGTYSYKYTDACESWTDSSTDNDGTDATAGNITGKDVCTTGTTGPGYITNFNSGKALDVTGGVYAAGTKLQQWTKGANSPSGVAGGDQQFKIVTESNGVSYLVAVSGSKSYYVTSSAKGSPLTLSTYPTSDAVLKKSGPFYEFVNTGLVMDVAGASKANGTKVEGWPENGGSNQEWSLP